MGTGFMDVYDSLHRIQLFFLKLLRGRDFKWTLDTGCGGMLTLTSITRVLNKPLDMHHNTVFRKLYPLTLMLRVYNFANIK